MLVLLCFAGTQGSTVPNAGFIATELEMNMAPDLYNDFLMEAVLSLNNDMKKPGFFCPFAPEMNSDYCTESSCGCNYRSMYAHLTMDFDTVHGTLENNDFFQIIQPETMQFEIFDQGACQSTSGSNCLGAIKVRAQIKMGIGVNVAISVFDDIISFCCGSWCHCGCGCGSPSHCKCEPVCNRPPITITISNPVWM
jgi:hypothetical protein